MADADFAPPPTGLSIAEIAALTGGQPSRSGRAHRVTGIAPLDRAGPDDLAYLDDARLAPTLWDSAAGICIVSAALAPDVPERIGILIATEPYRAFVLAARALFSQATQPTTAAPASSAGDAYVDRSARMEFGVTLDRGVVVGARAEIGAGTRIGANAVIGADVRIGRHCVIWPNASIHHALVGDRVVIHGGARIGEEAGVDARDEAVGLSLPRIGRVILQNGVRIGANAVIDRGAETDTVIGEGSKVDNLVQIGHNCRIGRSCRIGAQALLAGGVTLEDNVAVGHKAALAAGVIVNEGTRVAPATLLDALAREAAATRGARPA